VIEDPGGTRIAQSRFPLVPFNIALLTLITSLQAQDGDFPAIPAVLGSVITVADQLGAEVSVAKTLGSEVTVG
jgi:hypothetical protein